jgi:VanZ family protein
MISKKLWPRMVTLLWVISISAVCYFSLVPGLELPVDFWNADKVYHIIAYAWLALLPMLRFRTRKGAVLAACSLVILGIILEIAQTHIPGRIFSFLDITANGLGVLAGVVLGNSVRPKFQHMLLPAKGD